MTSCPDELTLTMYADGELDPAAAQATGAHALGCARCRRQVSALREERVLLRAALEAPRRPVSPPATSAVAAVAPGRAGRRASPPLAAALGVVMVALLGSAVSLTRFDLPPALRWLSPFHADGQINAFFSGVVYVVREGGAMVSSLFMTASLVALALCVAPFVLGLVRRVAASLGVGVVAVSLLVASPGEAVEIRHAEEGNVMITVGERVDDTVIATGDTVTVDGTVTGDLIVAARRVRIRGTIEGNVLVFAQDVEVGGSVVGFGQAVDPAGRVGGNLYGWGQNVTVAADAEIGGNAITFAAWTTIDGSIGRGVRSFGADTDIAGDIARDVRFYGARLRVFEPARIGGALTAGVADVTVAPGAVVSGGTVRFDEGPEARSEYLTGSFYVVLGLRIAAAFVTGWILFWLAPRFGAVRFETAADGLRAAGVGFLCLVAMPVGAGLVAITLVGLPLAAVTGVLWTAGIYLATVVMAAVAGRALLGPDRPAAATLLAGLVAIYVAINLPVVGWLVNLAVTITGMGALFTTLVSWYRAREMAAA